MEFASLARTSEDGTKWKGSVVKNLLYPNNFAGYGMEQIRVCKLEKGYVRSQKQT